MYNPGQYPELCRSTINEKFNLKNLSNTVNFDNKIPLSEKFILITIYDNFKAYFS
jgi:hypothetical protein